MRLGPPKPNLIEPPRLRERYSLRSSLHCKSRTALPPLQFNNNWCLRNGSILLELADDSNLKKKFQKQRELFPKTFYPIWLRTVTCLLCAFAGSKAPVF